MKRAIFAFVLIFSATIVAEEVPPASAEEVPVPEFINLETVDLSVAPETYEVVQGDTLWDISAAQLKSPWYWPKVWSMNPQISNPNLIYPGDKISFRMTGEMMMPGSEGGENGEYGEANGEYEDEGETDTLARTGKTLDATPENFKEFVKLGGKYRIDRFKQIDDTVFDVVQQGFVGKAETEDLAKVIGSFEPKELLATDDNVYVELGKVEYQIGEYVEFIHVKEKVKHPVSGDNVGSIVEIVGRGKVIDVGVAKKKKEKDEDKKIATVKIVKAYDAIERGFYVREYVKQEDNVQVSESSSDIKATILTGYDPTFYYGPNYIVYLDKGSKDGVEKGVMLSVYRRGDGLDEIKGDIENDQLPYEMVGELVVIQVAEETSVAVITNSITALEAGDSAVSGEIEK